MDSGIAALFGALVGGGATVAANYFQVRTTSVQERIKAAATLAAKEHDFDVTLGKGGKQHSYSLLSQYVGYYDAILRELESDRGIAMARLRELDKQYEIEPE